MNIITIEGNKREVLADRISADTYCVDREIEESRIILKVI